MDKEKICKYCGKPIPKGEVWNPDEHGNGYHHKCLIDMEFDENEAYMEKLKNHAIIIPEGATNGDMIKAMFPNYKFTIEGTWVYSEFNGQSHTTSLFCPVEFWNAPYKREVEE